MHKVSVIITTYNRAELLKAAIKGATKQTYSNLEIIVSDNASSDNTEEVVNEFKKIDSRVIYYRNSTNLGSLGNHMKALSTYATGDWAVFVSDDDYLSDPEFVASGMDLIENNGLSEVAFYQTGVITHYDSTGIDTPFAPNIDSDSVYKPGEYFKQYFNINFFSFTTTLFNRKYLIDQVLPRTIFGSDVQVMLAMSLDKKVILSKKLSGTYNIHSTQNFGKSSFMNYLKLYKDTYLEVCHYAQKYSNISAEYIDKWKKQSLAYYKLNVEGWIKNKMYAEQYFATQNEFLIRMYPRVKKYLGLTFVLYPIYKENRIEKINIYLPGLYYQIYWSIFSASLK